MAIQDLKSRIARLPEQPGVYLYYNEAGDTLYVGKAKVLRDRVRSYLGAQGMSPRIDALLDEAARLEFVVTDSVVEALALENHLIKQRAPKYNILLRDDKNYPFLQLTTGEAFPRVLIARSVEKDDHYYAGPFMPAKLGRRTMALTHRLFGIRSCNEAIIGDRARPCLEFDIHRCIAPCVREICSEETYQEAVQHTRLFLEGRNDELVAQLRERMAQAAVDEHFEQAAQLRDALRTIATLQQRQQKMAGTSLGDRDAFGLKVGPAGAVVQVFQVRGGKVVERIELASATANWKLETGDWKPENGGREPGTQGRGGQRSRRSPGRARAVLHRASGAAGDPPADRAERGRDRTDRGMADGSLRVPRAHRRAKARREARTAGTCRTQRAGRLPDALQRDGRGPLRCARNTARRAEPAGDSAAHRVFRHLHDPRRRNGGVDGGLRRRPHEALRVSQVQDPGSEVRRPTSDVRS